jgi:hypothetical protein
VALVGLEGRIVEVEADIGAGLPRTVLVGLPDSALYQARDRCKAAVSNSEQEWPISLLTINLSPATLPKAGSHYDVAIVAAVLAAQRVFRAEELRGTVLLGELGLDGRLRPIRGILPATLAAQQAGFTRVIVPLRQAEKLPNVSAGSTICAWPNLGSAALACTIGKSGRTWKPLITSKCAGAVVLKETRGASWSPDSGDSGDAGRAGLAWASGERALRDYLIQAR